jgi:diketogulonate reductase-like aldo/keto reductase
MNAKMNRRKFVTLSAAALAGSPGVGSATLMSQRRLGRTGVEAGILGMGGVGFLTDWDDREQIEALIIESIDAGVNYFDTAHNYGDGTSERSLGLVMGQSYLRGSASGSRRELEKIAHRLSRSDSVAWIWQRQG